MLYPNQEIACARAVGVVQASPAQVLRIVMATGAARCEWDEFYVSGAVTERPAPNIQLLHFVLRSLSNKLRKRDFVVARAFKQLHRSKKREEGPQLKEKLEKEEKEEWEQAEKDDRSPHREVVLVLLSGSVDSSAHPQQANVLRADALVDGWIIRKHGPDSSLVTRVVLVDFRGNIPPSVADTLNQRFVSFRFKKRTRKSNQIN